MGVKKLLRNLVLALLPLVLYYGVFAAFVGAQGLEKATPGAAGIERIWNYRAGPTPGVLVGDSRIAHLDAALVGTQGGRSYTNLAYGGASFKESLDELCWLFENYPEIDEVVLGLSFYTLNENYNADRFDTIEQAVYNPLAYFTNLSFNLEMLDSLRLYLASGAGALGGGATETRDPATYEWVEYQSLATGEAVMLRKDIVKYLGDIAGYTGNWKPATGQFERLLKLIEESTARGVRFVVVLPPMHPAVLQYGVREAGIEAQMLPLIEQLKATEALVLDYEFTNRPDFSEDQYYDGFHLDYVRGLPEWTEMLRKELAS